MKTRIISYDLIRVLAIIGVVAIHTENITSSPTNYLGGLSWWFANTIHSLICISVPLFVMLTGALLLNRKILTYRNMLPKLLNRLLIPLIFWVLFYAWWVSYRQQTDFVGISLHDIWTANIGHLYFLEIIIGLYLVLPPISAFIHRSSRYQQKIVLIAITALVVIAQSISFLLLKNYQMQNLLTLFLPFICYLGWGYYLSAVKISNRTLVYYLVAIVVLVGQISMASYLNVVALNHQNTLFWTTRGGNYFWDPFSVPVLLLSLLVFLFVKNIKQVVPGIFKNKQITVYLNRLAVLSFGIYLVHPVLIEIIDSSFNLAIHQVAFPLWIYYIVRTALVFVTAAIIVFLCSKLPLIKKAVGI